ncbi:hypothetical protein ACFPAF_16960 [Hymenobacter endophyticus]|uniref:Uncharacterized protein n=1 Tax=Hymenobacter endophyticus TaxID=3076335 RepID=A0ABU3TL67_9BACT|nr:hypothetical protein [Hymenobacter endophyticus]MDU0372095.1 hypothetical protein [Hymenobacter endophyticus]
MSLSAQQPSAFAAALTLPESVQQQLYHLIYQQDITPATLPAHVPQLAQQLMPLYEDAYGVAVTDQRELEALILSDAQRYLQDRK